MDEIIIIIRGADERQILRGNHEFFLIYLSPGTNKIASLCIQFVTRRVRNMRAPWSHEETILFRLF